MVWACCEEFCYDALRTLYIYSLTSTSISGFIFLRTGFVTVDGLWYRLVSCVDDSSRPTATRTVRQQRLLGFLKDDSAWFDVVWQAIEKLYACIGWLLRIFAKIYGGEMTRECCSCCFVHPQLFYYT